MTAPHPVDPLFPVSEGGGELFPVNFTSYQHHYLPDLDTEQHVRAIADLLAPYGVHTTEWTVPAAERNRQAVEDRLGDWKQPARGGNTVLYWVGHGSADHLAHHCTSAPIDDGVTPQDIARVIGRRQLHPDSEGSWAIVVLDACFSKDFARSVHSILITEFRGADRFLLLSSAAEGYTELGDFTRALKHALTITFLGQKTIGLTQLGSQLARDLRGYRADHVDDHRDQLVRLTADAASAVSAPLDQITELQAVIDQLPPDAQRHFLPKASGAELGELAWYFHGRTLQRDQILHWLNTANSGVLVVTGPAGAGKSALLGHVLLHTNTRLRDILVRHGHLDELPPGTDCPDDPFDLTAHLAGLTPARTLHLVALAAGLADLAQQATEGQPPADLTSRLLSALRARHTPLTLLFDALDEADQPLVIADQILRPLATLPQVRVLVGTRRSTREGPDHPAPDDTDLLDALRPRPAPADDGRTANLQCVEVTRDAEALVGYLRAKLHAAKRRGALDADDTLIAIAVRRLVTDHQQDGVEPQQFLYARLAAHELLANPALLADPAPLISCTHRQLFTHALDRLHRTNRRYTPLLRALGLAQGRGLPDQNGVWVAIADALTPDGGTGTGIPGLLRDAAPYITLDQEHGRSVYRLAHRTFTEHFTTAPDTPAAHAAITRALIEHARRTAEPHDPGSGTAARPEDVSPYTRHHLTTHARLGHTAGALHALANHADVLDTLDLTSITANTFQSDLAPNDLPPPIAGTLLLQHLAQGTHSERPGHDPLGWRRWWRRLGTTYIQGTPPPAETHPHSSPAWPPTLIAAAVHRRQLHLQLTGHIDAVLTVAVFAAPDGTPRLATAGRDRTVRIWNPTTGTQVGEVLTSHASVAIPVAMFTALDGTPRLALSTAKGTVGIWNPTTGTQEGELTGHLGRVYDGAVFAAPDGTPRLATAGRDRTVRIWNPATGTQVGEALDSHTETVRAVAVFTAPDGNPRLALGGANGTVRIWNPATGSYADRSLTGHTGPVRTVAVFTASDGTPRLATAGYDQTARLWNPTTGTQVGEALTGHTDRVQAVAGFNAPDGTPRLATASQDRTVRIWNPTADTQGGGLIDHTGWLGWVYAMAVFAAPNGTPRLATAGYDGTVRIWNPTTGTQVGEALTGHTDRVQAVAGFNAPDGTPRFAIGDSYGTVRIWNPLTTQVSEAFTAHSGSVWAVAVFAAPDGTPRLATAGADGTVRIWNATTGAQDGELTDHPRHPRRTRHIGRIGRISQVYAVAAFTAPDGTPRLTTAGADGTVRIWNPATSTQVGDALCQTREVPKVAVFSASDGSPRLVVGNADGTVQIWNPRTGT
ncbi:AAA family ATPase, partial [Streptomyces aureus]